jgi:hypothetical protein
MVRNGKKKKKKKWMGHPYIFVSDAAAAGRNI